MQGIRHQQGERPEDESVSEDFRPRQYQAIEVADQIAIQQNVDIQRQAFTLRSIATVVGFDTFQPAVQLSQRQLAITGHHQVEERPALDAHRLAFKYRRAAHVTEQAGERLEASAQVRFAADIAAKAE